MASLKFCPQSLGENGIKAKLRRRFKNKKQQISNRVVAPNILDQRFTTDQPNWWPLISANPIKICCYIAIKGHSIPLKITNFYWTQKTSFPAWAIRDVVTITLLQKSSLERELLILAQQTRTAIFEYIEIFYNKQRRHSTINYCIPAQFILMTETS